MSEQARMPSRAGAAPSVATVRGATLDGFAEAAHGPGLRFTALERLTTLIVDTRNTRYRIVIVRGDEIVIQGGRFFPDATTAHLEGATLGGSLLKVGWIGVGLRMEIRAGDQRIVTTPVRSIVRDGSNDGGRAH